MRAIASTVLVICATHSALASGVMPSCRGSWNIVGVCYPVHGSLRIARPASRKPEEPSATITTRNGKAIGVLGRSYGTDAPDLFPPALAALMLKPEMTQVEGDFLLCPLDRDIQRFRMRMVCIEDASNLTPRQ